MHQVFYARAIYGWEQKLPTLCGMVCNRRYFYSQAMLQLRPSHGSADSQLFSVHTSYYQCARDRDNTRVPAGQETRRPQPTNKIKT